MKFALHKVNKQYLKDSDRLKVNMWRKRIKQHLPIWEKGQNRRHDKDWQSNKSQRECQLISLTYLFLYEYTETLHRDVL